jgi:dolichyl-phosphate beta-glucosyltransferase
MKNGIVIPCYNESLRLPLQTYQAFLDCCPDYQICFVNDGSQDHTLSLLETMQAQNPRQVQVLNLVQNQGKAEAVRLGIQHLFRNHDLQTVGFMDADLSTGFGEYQNLVQHLRADGPDCEMVFGSRKIKGESEAERSLFRRLTSKLAGALIRSVLRLSIKDTQCGAKVFRPELARIVFDTPFVSRWLFDVELFVRLKKRYGRDKIWTKMREIPLRNWVHVAGSKISVKDSVQLPMQLGQIVLTYHFRPSLQQTSRRFKVYRYRLAHSLNLL